MNRDDKYNPNDELNPYHFCQVPLIVTDATEI